MQHANSAERTVTTKASVDGKKPCRGRVGLIREEGERNMENVWRMYHRSMKADSVGWEARDALTVDGNEMVPTAMSLWTILQQRQRY